MKSISRLNIDLSWFRVVCATERLAVVKEEPAVRQIERCDGERQVFGNRFTG
jgi:alkylated DNA nucleotide flippase Atl1